MNRIIVSPNGLYRQPVLRVRIIWRESLFFRLIQGISEKAAIIAQVKVLS